MQIAGVLKKLFTRMIFQLLIDGLLNSVMPGRRGSSISKPKDLPPSLSSLEAAEMNELFLWKPVGV
jgi:hypothetical protein